VWLSVIIGALYSLATPDPTLAESPGQWILGVWEGSHAGGTYIRDDKTRFEFTQAGEVIKWKRSREWSSVRGPGWDEASGTVTKIAESSAELEGHYDTAHFSSTVGKPIKYSLTRKANDVLEGYAIGAANVSFPVSIKRSK